MTNFFKGKFVTGLVVLATIILAAVAIFTALRLYQLRTQPVAPTAPERPRAAAPVACQQLAFTITTGSPTLTPTGSVTPTQAPSLTITPTTPPGSSPTPTTPPGATSTPTPTTGEIAQNSPTPTGGGSISAVSPTPGGATLPDAGISSITLLSLSTGLLVIIAALMLAL